MTKTVRELIHDPISLAIKSVDATPDDIATAHDLRDTLAAHSDECVGMAANMIGCHVRIIVFDDGGKYTVMYNPTIIRSDGAYRTSESCLSLPGGPRPVKRYGTIRVRYQTEDFKTRTRVCTGFTAQIIQHEIDHTNGILI